MEGLLQVVVVTLDGIGCYEFVGLGLKVIVVSDKGHYVIPYRGSVSQCSLRIIPNMARIIEVVNKSIELPIEILGFLLQGYIVTIGGRPISGVE